MKTPNRGQDRHASNRRLARVRARNEERSPRNGKAEPLTMTQSELREAGIEVLTLSSRLGDFNKDLRRFGLEADRQSYGSARRQDAAGLLTLKR